MEKFNPRDEKTYRYADSTKITVIDGVEIYESVWEGDIEYKTYLSQTSFVEKIEEYWQWHSDYLKNNPNSKIKTKKDFIESQVKSYILTCADYSIKKSNLSVNGYNFSVAQVELIKNMAITDIEKLSLIIQNHFKNKEKRYKLRQAIYDNGIPVDNYLFADLCFAKDIEKEQEIMEEYFCKFDYLETKEQLEKLIDNDYLNLYPELKERVRNWLLINLGL